MVEKFVKITSIPQFANMSWMGAFRASSMEEANGEEKPKLKICCACPETKAIRDKCVIENGESGCAHLIAAHKACLRELGFKV